MKKTPEDLYLDLMKKTLSFLLWPEPPLPVEASSQSRSSIKKATFAVLQRVLRSRGMSIVQERTFSQEQREEGRVWPYSLYAHSMIGLKRLDNLQMCVENVIRDGVRGDLIETGVWRGGACILMRAVLGVYGVEDRLVYVADSFQGLPEPDPEKYPADSGDTLYRLAYLAVTQQEVAENFRRYGLLDDQVVFLKGWFCDTLPTAPIQELAVMRLDGDMYESTMDALTNLYPKLSPGGYCIVDDYALETCRRAVDDFRSSNAVDEQMIEIDYSGRYWRKR